MKAASGIDFLERISRLERLVRKLQLGISFGGVLLLMLFVTAFSRAQRATASGNPVRVHRIAVTDANGTTRILLDVSSDGPEIKCFDSDGHKVVAMVSEQSHGGELALAGISRPGTNAGLVEIDANPTGASLNLYGHPGAAAVTAMVGTEATFRLFGSRGTMTIEGSDETTAIRLADRKSDSGAEFVAGEDGPSLRLHDANGYSASLGVERLVTDRTGEHQKTSAASLILFGKDQKMLWSAP